MNWFQNLNQLDQDNVVQFLSQSIHHYGHKMNENVVIDMKQEFGMSALQTQQLYEVFGKSNYLY